MFELERVSVAFVAGTLGRGGAEQQLYYMLAALVSAGARPRLISLTRGEYWEAPVRALGVAVESVGDRPSRACRLTRIVRALGKAQIDVIQSQHFFTNLYAVAAARMLGARELCAIRSDGAREVRANGRILGPLSLRMPRMLAANSLAAVRNAMAFGVAEQRIRLLPNVVDTDRFAPSERRDGDPFRLVAVGRLMAVKRFDRFVEIVGALSRSGVRVEAAILGDGPERGRLKALAHDAGLADDVLVLRGAVDDVAAELGRADAVVSTSDAEGTPNALLEAMACGVPVVASRVGGVPDLVRDGVDGFLADPDDLDSMVRALRLLAIDRELGARIGRRGRERVAHYHALDRLPHYLADIYEATLS